MDIYSSAVSPFSVRVRLGAAAKGRAVRELKLPEGGVRSEEFRRINPVGKIPVLVTKCGRTIAESAAILWYLEHRFPTPSLLPNQPAERAAMDSACRMVDLYLAAPIIRLFGQLDPAARNSALFGNEVEHWTQGAKMLSGILEALGASVQAPWSMLDCILAPTLHLSRRISAMLDLHEDPATTGGLASAYDSYADHPRIGDFLRTLTLEQEDYDLAAGRPSVAARH